MRIYQDNNLSFKGAYNQSGRSGNCRTKHHWLYGRGNRSLYLPGQSLAKLSWWILSPCPSHSWHTLLFLLQERKVLILPGHSWNSLRPLILLMTANLSSLLFSLAGGTLFGSVSMQIPPWLSHCSSCLLDSRHVLKMSRLGQTLGLISPASLEVACRKLHEQKCTVTCSTCSSLQQSAAH